MEKLDHNYLIATMGLIAIVLELLLGAPTGFDLLFLGAVFLIGGIVGSITGNFIYSVLFIVVFSALLIFISRKFVKTKLHINARKQ